MATRQIQFIILILSMQNVCHAADPEPLGAPEKCGQMPRNPIDESSGLIHSRRYPEKDLFWTHNDSGDKARLFAVDSKGTLLREYKVSGATNYDWEEITADDKGNLIVGDIGDNGARRKEIVLYRFPEPDALAEDARRTTASVQSFRFNYPAADGAQDAEALVARGDCAYLITKTLKVTRCYRLPLPDAPPKETVEAVCVASTTTINTITGAALSPDGTHLALVNYLSVTLLSLPQPIEKLEKIGELFDCPRRVRLAWLGQTEAVAWDHADLVLTTEGGAIYRIAGVLDKK